MGSPPNTRIKLRLGKPPQRLTTVTKRLERKDPSDKPQKPTQETTTKPQNGETNSLERNDEETFAEALSKVIAKPPGVDQKKPQGVNQTPKDAASATKSQPTVPAQPREVNENFFDGAKDQGN